MADKWLNDYIEIELDRFQNLKVCSTLSKILDAGYVKTDLGLRHFDVYEKGNKKLLYNPSKNLIEMIYDVKKVFGGIESSSFSTIDFELGEKNETRNFK